VNTIVSTQKETITLTKEELERDYVRKIDLNTKEFKGLFEDFYIEKQKVRDALNKVRKKHCIVFKDGCKNTAGLCDSCEIIEELEEVLKL
jgi:hypothetical protein